MSVIPAFTKEGALPAGVHWLDWAEFVEAFGFSSRRRHLLKGLRESAILLADVGCKVVYVDGSFVTAKEMPGDFDACWDIDGVDAEKVDPIFFDFRNRRAAQKSRFGGEWFPAQMPEGVSGRTFLAFFQNDKETGNPKGIVGIRIVDIRNEEWRQ